MPASAAAAEPHTIYRRAVDVVARHAGVRSADVVASPLHVHRRHRGRAIYLAVCAFGVPAASVARVAGIRKQSAHSWLRRVEDMRDDPAVDADLNHLEELLAC